MKNGRNKGSAYERHIAKKLGAWWGEKFQRTPASGGLDWGKDNRVCGDIVTPPGSEFPFTVECKKRENWTMDSLFKGSKEVEKWWAQVNKDCERSGLLPMLVFSRNLQPDYVCLAADDYVSLFYWDTPNREALDRIHVRLNGEEVIIVSLDAFMEMAHPATIAGAALDVLADKKTNVS
ncbi:hypothetical protein EauM23_00060 [Exiguobacterium phage vB_EauM-23]|nr:hypothetical protein EauM23_00060 [Exiguobacterium phage vB_EauM-23]